ncbi:MAG: tRNA epoxyqueuosine(34) reductase QueG [Flavobacteriia bacterium]|nr:tRNA epoxyqueuosine(34) reductase QueG [Flavobacteriia bacterium]
MTKNHLQQQEQATFIKGLAERLGFMACGISKAGFLEEEAPRLEQWLAAGKQGKMGYMENHFDMRLDPTLLVPGAKSVISLLYNYFPEEVQGSGTYKIAKYAYGQDYHHVIKKKLRKFQEAISTQLGPIQGRAFVDSAPVLEKAWAAKSGLGWVGKNTNLIKQKSGSFFFIAELILDLELPQDPIATDHCGSCTACIDACPTQALTPYEIDGSKCISYFTIELKDAIPTSVAGQFEDWAFGCDICQDVCPWNRFSTPHNQPLFNPHSSLLSHDKKQWEELTADVFGEIFRKSAVKRAKYEGFKRNVSFLKGPH